jgi:phosphopantetheinyl transferase
MSHSDGLPIYAINRKRKIGVDVERVRPVPESNKIVEAVFPATDQARLAARRPDQRAEAFLGWWTRNEARLKASGDGLCRWMDSIDDSARDGQPSRSNAADSDSEETVGWSFQRSCRLPVTPPRSSWKEPIVVWHAGECRMRWNSLGLPPKEALKKAVDRPKCRCQNRVSRHLLARNRYE